MARLAIQAGPRSLAYQVLQAALWYPPGQRADCSR